MRALARRRRKGTLQRALTVVLAVASASPTVRAQRTPDSPPPAPSPPSPSPPPRPTPASPTQPASAKSVSPLSASPTSDESSPASPTPALSTSSPALQPGRVVVAPFNSLTEGMTRLAAIEDLVGRAAATVPGFELVPAKELARALRKDGRPQLKQCDGQEDCLAELGALVGATHVLAGEVGAIGEGVVAYLKAVGVAERRDLASTTAVFTGDAAARQKEARAAAYRILAPRSYVGRLQLDIDVGGAKIYVDGRFVARAPAPPIVVGVGTHALRVTHEQYRDFVRFVDVAFDETTQIPVELKAFPIVSDEIRAEGGGVPLGPPPRREVPVEPTPWYREPWAVAAFGGAVLLTTTLLVVATTGGIDFDDEVTVRGR